MNLTKRQHSIMQFALMRFIDDAYYYANVAGQDKKGKFYPPEACNKFLTDAKDAEELLTIVRKESPK